MLYTKSELLLILGRWEVTEPLPPKGKKLFVAFPNSMKDFEVDLAVVEKTNLNKSAEAYMKLGIVRTRPGTTRLSRRTRLLFDSPKPVPSWTGFLQCLDSRP